MAAFPTLAYNPSLSSEEELLDDIQVDRATNGSARGRAFYTSPKKKFTIVFTILTTTDKDTVHSFYLANRLIPFTFLWVADGVTYTCLFSKPPKYKVGEGMRWTVTIPMEEQ